MILLAGAAAVLPDRVLPASSVILDGDRIAAIEPRIIDTPQGATRVDLQGCTIVPGFVDVHVHGVEGHDVLDGPGAVAAVASRLPRYGVTSFCPTSIACDPSTLLALLREVSTLTAATAASARVLPAHLESNFINPDFKGAQPASCLRIAQRCDQPSEAGAESIFTGDDVLAVIDAQRAAIGIVTIAPELGGGLDLVRRLASAGHRVSIGHSGATYEQTLEAIDAGVTHATHLFNRMSAMTHRAPGVPGAVLQSDRVRVELICDGFHVHPALMSIAVRAKGPNGVMAITDGTAGSGLPVGTRTHLGGYPILVTDRTAVLDDGTVAGSVLTMDGAFRTLVRLGTSLVDAAAMCATTPAEQVGRPDLGRMTVGATADLTVLDASLRVQMTILAGRRWRNQPESPSV